MKLGIESLIENHQQIQQLQGKRVALLAHPASVTHQLSHSVDILASRVSLSSLFGPQHGIRGDKQDNMIETDDDFDTKLRIPVFSLYGKVRRPTPEMMKSFDVLLVDLQDIGCRIYTYLTTLYYMMEACAQDKKALWVLDRPNPAGRDIEGFFLEAGWESFVGIAPFPMRHGMTLGECSLWMKDHFSLPLELKIIPMHDYDPNEGPGYGWPDKELSWVNPSPNVPTLSTVRCFAGTVFLEGTNLSEGRGTTVPLQMFGAPKLKVDSILEHMNKMAPSVFEGVRVRSCSFEPTFHKYKGQLCHGIQLHVDQNDYVPHRFRPYRFMAQFFKSCRVLQPHLFGWRPPPYEYENERLAFDLLNGGPRLRLWIEDDAASFSDLDLALKRDESEWQRTLARYSLYPASTSTRTSPMTL